MKQKYLSAFLAVCVFIAFPSVLHCQCVGSDCGSSPKSLQAKTPPCHPAAAPAKGRDSSGSECCGKCRIEKAAVLSEELSPVNEIRSGNTLVEIKSFSDFHLKLRRPSVFRGESQESPPGFFEQHVLNTTFSFRAPPQGHALRVGKL